MSQPSEGRSRSRKRRAWFALTCALAPVAALLVAELVARAAWPARNDDAFLALDRPQSLFSEVTVDGQRCYQVTHPEAYRTEDLRFPIDKPKGTLRVFCLGESASAGWPHPPAETYWSYLAKALQRAHPDRKVEVLNVGAHAYASYRVRLIFDDVIRFAPDLLILWCGNNEFVEKRAYLVHAGLGRLAAWLARHSRLFGIVRSALSPESRIKATALESLQYLEWTQTEQIASELRSDPAQLASVCEHYGFSIEHMVGAAERAGVPIVVLTVPVNLRDWHPHKSRATLPEAERPAFAAQLRAGRGALLAGDPARALRLLEEALQREPEHAEALFWKGRALEASGRRDEALLAFRAAKDADQNPFRCLSAFNATLRRVAAAHGNATLLDMEDLCAREVGGAPGFDLFLDYVHPSKRGNLTIARHVFATIVAKGLLPAPPAVREFDPGETAYADERDPFLQITLLSLLSTMHQYEAFLAKLDLFEDIRRAGLFTVPESMMKDVDDLLARCRSEFTSYLENERAEMLGNPFDAEFRDKHKVFYRDYFTRLTRLKANLSATKQ